MADITVFYRPTCPFCLKALNLLYDMYPIAHFNMYNVTARPDVIDIMHQYLPDANTYPQILIDGDYVGGYSELLERAHKTND